MRFGAAQGESRDPSRVKTKSARVENLSPEEKQALVTRSEQQDYREPTDPENSSVLDRVVSETRKQHGLPEHGKNEEEERFDAEQANFLHQVFKREIDKSPRVDPQKIIIGILDRYSQHLNNLVNWNYKPGPINQQDPWDRPSVFANVDIDPSGPERQQSIKTSLKPSAQHLGQLDLAKYSAHSEKLQGSPERTAQPLDVSATASMR